MASIQSFVQIFINTLNRKMIFLLLAVEILLWVLICMMLVIGILIFIIFINNHWHGGINIPITSITSTIIYFILLLARHILKFQSKPSYGYDMYIIIAWNKLNCQEFLTNRVFTSISFIIHSHTIIIYSFSWCYDSLEDFVIARNVLKF